MANVLDEAGAAVLDEAGNAIAEESGQTGQTSNGFTFLQLGPTALTTTGSIAPTLPTQSTRGTLLIAHLFSGNGATGFSAPPGWQQVPRVAYGANVSATELWYYPSNPGGITSATFTNTNGVSIKGYLTEWSSSPGTTQRVFTVPGTATGGAATSYSITGLTLPAGLLAIYTVALTFSSYPVGDSWTDPTGFTRLRAGTATVVPNLGAYQILTDPLTPPVAATHSTSANMLGWSGMLVAFQECRFSPIRMDGGGAVNVLALSPDGVLMGGSDTQGYYRSFDRADHWTVQNKGVGKVDEFRQSAGLIWSVTEPDTLYSGTGEKGSGGGLLVSADGGNSWTLRSDTVQFAGVSSDDGVLPDNGWKRSTGHVLLQETTGSHYLWAATFKDGIMRSADNGVTWTTCNMSGAAPARGEYYACALAWDAANPTVMYAAVWDNTGTSLADATLWVSTNAHATTPNFVPCSPSSPPPPPTGGGIIGSYAPDGAYVIGETRMQAADRFDANFNNQTWAHNAQKVFFGGPNSWHAAVADGAGKDMVPLVNAGCQLWVCCEPAVDGSDATALHDWLYGWLQTVPADQLVIIPWQECQNKSTALGGSSGYKAMMHYYAPTLHGLGLKIAYDAAGSHTLAQWLDWAPPYADADIIGVDLYGTAYKGKTGGTVSGNQIINKDDPDCLYTLYHYADQDPNHNTAFCIPEMGSSVIPTEPISEVWFNDYITYISNLLSSRAAAGKPMAATMWYDCNRNNPNTNTIGGPHTTIAAASSSIQPATNPDWQHTGTTGDPFLGVLNVASTANFDATPGSHGGGADNPTGIGRLWCQMDNGTVAHITYTSTTATQFRGCAYVEGSPTGHFQTGGPVELYPFTSGDTTDFRVAPLSALYTACHAGLGGAPLGPNNPPVTPVTDIQIIGGKVYCTCAHGGVFRYDPDATPTTGTWNSLDGIPTTPTNRAGNWWKNIAGYVDGSGNHVVIAGDSNTQSAAAALIKMVIPSTWPGSGSITYTNMVGSVQISTIPPDNRTWWHASSSFQNWLGGAGFQLPYVLIDSSDLSNINIYCSGSGGSVHRKLGSGGWTVCNNGIPGYLGRDLAVDPNNPLRVAWTSSDWTMGWADDGIGYDASHCGQEGPGAQGYALAFDPVDSTFYMSSSTSKYTNQGGLVSQRSTFPGRAGTWSDVGNPTLASLTGDKVALGLCALRDAGGSKVLLAAVWAGGLWRWTAATGWARVGQNLTALCTGTGSYGFHQYFAHVAGSRYVYLFDRGSGVYRSADYGQTWVLVWSMTSTDNYAGGIAANPNVSGEVWVSSNSGLYKISNAHTGVQNSGATRATVTLPDGTDPGDVAIHRDGTKYVITQDTGSGAGILYSVNGTNWYDAVGDPSFAESNSRPARIVAAYDGRLYISGSNIVTTGFPQNAAAVSQVYATCVSATVELPTPGVTGSVTVNANVVAAPITPAASLPTPVISASRSITVTASVIDASVIIPAVRPHLEGMPAPTVVDCAMQFPFMTVYGQTGTNVLGRPRMVVEGAFHLDDSGNRIWSDISDYIDLEASEVTISARRQTLFDERSAATLAFSVSNVGGEFTDTNTSSPFYPGITQNTPLRVRVQYPVTENLLHVEESLTNDANFWTAEHGDLSVSTDNPSPGAPASIVWATGLLRHTGIRVSAGQGPWDGPSDKPIHVKAGEVYSSLVNLRADAAISVSLKMSWYDLAGTLVSEDTSDIVALTTSWQSLSITGVSAPVDGELRIHIVNETLILPVTQAIVFHDATSDTRQHATSMTLTIPEAARNGDVVFLWRRINNPTDVFQAVPGFTYRTSWVDSSGKTRLDYRTITASEPGTSVTVQWGGTPCRAVAAFVAYGGVDSGTPIHKIAELNESAYTAAHLTPNVTTTIADCWIVSAVFDTSTTTSLWTPPAGEIIRACDYSVKSDAATGIVTDDGLAHAAGTYGSKTFTSNTSTKTATMTTLALTPATELGSGTTNVYIGAPMLVRGGSIPQFTAGGKWTSLIIAYADSWNPYWETAEKAVVEVMATDRSKLLDSLTVGSAIHETIMDSGPVLFYTLDEDSDSTEAADSSDVSQPALEKVQIGNDGTLEFGSGTGPGMDGTAAVMSEPKDSSNGLYLCAESMTVPVGDVPSVSAGFCFNSTVTETNELTMLKLCPVTSSSTSRSLIEFYGKPSNYVGVKARLSSDAGAHEISAQTSSNVFDGATHMISATYSVLGGQATLVLYLDGDEVASTTAATPASVVPSMNAMSVGGAYKLRSRLCGGTYSNVWAFNFLLSDADMASIWTAALNAFSGDGVCDRFYRLMDWADLTGTDLDDTDVLVGPHPAGGSSALSALQLVANSDGGTLFINGDDQVAFRSAVTKEMKYVPAVSMSANDLAVSPTGTKNDQLIVNDITVSWVAVKKATQTQNGQHLIDTASIKQYGVHDKQVDTLLISADDAREMAGYYLAFYSQPITRLDEISVEALLFSEWNALLSLDMWDIIRITDLPSTAPSSQLDSHLEGIEWNIGLDSWLVTMDVSYAIPYGVVGDPARDIAGAMVVAR